MVLGQKEPTSKFLQAMKKEEGSDLIREETSVSANTPGAPPVAREKVKCVACPNSPPSRAWSQLSPVPNPLRCNTASRWSRL